MKPIFASIEEEDTLYVVYEDLNHDYQIGEAKVTGFTHWTYTYGDQYEDYGTKPMKNINYEFRGIKFSRNLEYSLNDTYFRDSPTWESDHIYNKILGDRFVIVFTTYEEAKECIISMLTDYINSKSEQIFKLKQEIEKYNANLIKYTTNEN